jgi:hypothetical protein
MDVGRALTFPFDDEEALPKFVVGSLMMAVGMVVPFIPLGYQVHVARGVMRGKRRPLPGAGELGELVTEGFMAFIALVAYTLPLALFGCMMGVMGDVLGSSDLGGLLFLCLACCLSGFVLLYALIAGALFTMGIIRFCETGNFVEFVRIGSLWADVREHLGTLVGLLVYLVIFGFVVLLLAPFSVIACGVGLLVLMFYAAVVSGYLYGQAGLNILEMEEYSGPYGSREWGA